MGVLNVTPDSFHPASRFPEASRAVAHGKRLLAEGADVLDVGGESTRPGARPLPEAAELARVLPVVRALARERGDVPLSIDTYKAEVARQAVLAGATIVNDVSGGSLDSRMPQVVAEAGATVVVGHLRGTPETMARAPEYEDVVAEVIAELRSRVEAFRRAGVPDERIWVDPGIGFGKSADASRTLLAGLADVACLGHPVVIGVSRKSFLEVLLRRAGLGDSTPADRLEASLAAAVLAAERGAVLVRAHDVAATRRALAVVDGVRG